MAITLSVGTRLPAAHTSMGRVLLSQLTESELNAYLERISLKRYTDKTINDKEELKRCIVEVRQQGYSIVDQELDSGLRSVAVPVFDIHDKLIGAINISTNAARVDMEMLLNIYKPLLQDKAQLIRQTVNT